MGRWHALREPTVPILLLASVVHVVRRNVFDFLLFFGTAVVIIVESRVEARRVAGPIADGALDPSAPLTRRGRWWTATAIALVSFIVALLPIAGGLVRTVLGVGGLAVLVAVLARPAPPPAASESRRVVGWQLWATVGVAACLWELACFIEQQVWPADQLDHPAASDLIGPLLSAWVGRAVFLLLWVSAGWWLLRQLVTSVGTAPRAESAVAGPSVTPVIIIDDEAAGNAGVDGRARDVGGRTEAGR